MGAASLFGRGESFLNFTKCPDSFFRCILQNSSVTVQKLSTGEFFHCVRLPIPKPLPKAKGRPLGALLLLVEARGVEPLSENLLIQLSPSAFRLLDFPLIGGGGQPSLAGSHLMRDALDGERRVHVHRLLDAQSRAAILSGGTGGVITPRHCR